MSKQAFPIDYRQEIAIVQALRVGLDKVKHHERFTKRIKPALESALPGYTVSVSDDGHFARVQVWGNGLSYDDSVRLSWVTGPLAAGRKPWAEQMAEEIDRNDYSDYAERQVDEIALLPELDKVNAQIEALRAQAQAMIAALPKPAAVKLRTSDCHWSDASSALRDRYPLVFKDSR